MAGGRIAVAAVLFLFMCGEDEEAVPVTVEVESEAMQGPEVLDVAPVGAPPAANGGTVVGAGPYFVEVVAHDDGALDSYMLADDPPPAAETQLTVHLTGDDGASHPVILVWDPAQSSYRGRLRQVRPIPGPVEVVVVHAGATHRGRRQSIIVLAPEPRTVSVGGGPNGPPPTGVAGGPPPPPPNGQLTIQRPQPAVVVRPARPHIEVQSPRPQVQVRGPRPRHEVRVQGPRRGPAKVRVDRRGRARGHRRPRRPHKRGHGTRVRIRH